MGLKSKLIEFVVKHDLMPARIAPSLRHEINTRGVYWNGWLMLEIDIF
jgi:hypothetical protein